MDVLINIGLARPDGLQMAASTALAAVKARGLRWDEAKLHVIGGKEVIVLRLTAAEAGFNVGAVARQVGHVANDLGQDCLAIWFGDEGKLVGPRCSAWGEFDPTKFLLLDGSRLQNKEA